MKSIVEMADELYADSKTGYVLNEFERKGYIKGARGQKEIDKNALIGIYDLYSALIDDLYTGYRLCDYNGGIVDVFGETISMGEALDRLNALFNKALFPKAMEE